MTTPTSAALTTTSANWIAVSSSARGSSHERSGAPNQDAVRVTALPAGMAVAVADGHGGPRYVRSDVGAAVAAHTAVEIAARWVGELGNGSADEVRRLVRERMVPDLVSAWRVAVLADHSGAPFTAEEQQRSGGGLDGEPLIAYGTTLLLAVAMPRRLVLCQIGDGDVSVVDQERQVRSPIAADDRLVGGTTTSLCLPTAADDFRISVLAAREFELVLLSTDGYGNSFADPHWRSSVGADLHDLLHGDGVESVEEQLPRWVADSARVGGDDVTVALLWRPLGAPAAAAVASDSTGTASTEIAPTTEGAPAYRPVNAVESGALLASPAPTVSVRSARSVSRPLGLAWFAIGAVLGALLTGAVVWASWPGAKVAGSRPGAVASTAVPSAVPSAVPTGGSTAPPTEPPAQPGPGAPQQPVAAAGVSSVVGPQGEIVVFRSRPGKADPRLFAARSDLPAQISAVSGGRTWTIRDRALSSTDNLDQSSRVPLARPDGERLTPVGVVAVGAQVWVLCDGDRLVAVDVATARQISGSYEPVKR